MQDNTNKGNENKQNQENVAKELQSIQNELDKLAPKITAADNKLQDSKNNQTALSLEIEGLNDKIKKIDKRNKESKEKLDTLNGELQGKNEALAELKNNELNLQSELQKVKDDKSKLEADKGKAETTQKELQEEKSKLDEEKQGLVKLNDKLNSDLTPLEMEKVRLDNVTKELKEVREGLDRQLKEVGDKLAVSKEKDDEVEKSAIVTAKEKGENYKHVPASLLRATDLNKPEGYEVIRELEEVFKSEKPIKECVKTEFLPNFTSEQKIQIGKELFARGQHAGGGGEIEKDPVVREAIRQRKSAI